MKQEMGKKDKDYRNLVIAAISCPLIVIMQIQVSLLFANGIGFLLVDGMTTFAITSIVVSVLAFIFMGLVIVFCLTRRRSLKIILFIFAGIFWTAVAVSIALCAHAIGNLSGTYDPRRYYNIADFTSTLASFITLGIFVGLNVLFIILWRKREILQQTNDTETGMSPLEQLRRDEVKK